MSRGSKTTERRSGLEDRVEAQLKEHNIDYTYENREDIIEYVLPVQVRRYLPDFRITTRSGRTFFIEAKGIWDYDDRFKHLLIRQQHPQIEIRFLFERANKRIRKGSRTTYRDICEGRGRGIWKDVTWQYAEKTIPPEWFDE